MIFNTTRLIKQIAVRFWDKPALFNAERKREFTFGELHKITNKVSNLLQGKFALGHGDVYATVLDNDNVALLHMWSMKSRVTELWLGVRDSKEENIRNIDLAEARLVFIEERLLEEYYEDLRQRGILIVVMDKPEKPGFDVYNFWELLKQTSDKDPNEDLAYDDIDKHIALLRFTGGTTGKAKCAMYTLSNLFLAALNPINNPELFPYDQPKAMLTTPLTHAAGQIPLVVYFKGGTVITLNQTDIEEMCTTVEQTGANFIYTVPTVLYRMLDKGLPQKYNLSTLKTIRYGASPISPAKLGALLGQFGNIFVQGYGATEAWSPITILGRKDHGLDTEDQKRILSSVGSPVPGTELMVCNERGEQLPEGEEGEIWIRGPSTVAGYYKDEEQTAQNFSKTGFWKSGDMGYIDKQGRLYLLDRKKDMIISGGFNVYSQEVENVLNSHPAVQNSAVVGVPHEDWGELVLGEVVLKEGFKAGQDEIIKYCKERLTFYKVPKTIEFIKELPISSAGKVLRRKVKEKYWKNTEKRIH